MLIWYCYLHSWRMQRHCVLQCKDQCDKSLKILQCLTPTLYLFVLQQLVHLIYKANWLSCFDERGRGYTTQEPLSLKVPFTRICVYFINTISLLPQARWSLGSVPRLNRLYGVENVWPTLRTKSSVPAVFITASAFDDNLSWLTSPSGPLCQRWKVLLLLCYVQEDY